jgi:hypothetical protein
MLTDIQIDIMARLNTALLATSEAHKLAIKFGLDPLRLHLRDARSHLIHAYNELLQDELKNPRSNEQ